MAVSVLPLCPARVQLLARQRIPSGAYADPLSHIFDEFDQNRDGSLTAAEVAAALRSRQVDITDEQAGVLAAILSNHAGSDNRTAALCLPPAHAPYALCMPRSVA